MYLVAWSYELQKHEYTTGLHNKVLFTFETLIFIANTSKQVDVLNFSRARRDVFISPL